MILFKRNNISIVVGRVFSCNTGHAKDGTKVFSVVLADCDESTDYKLEVAFWNDKTGTNMRADRLEKAAVSVGSVLTAAVILSDTDSHKAIGLNWKYTGQWVFSSSLNNDAPSEIKKKAMDLFDELKRNGFIRSDMLLDVSSLESLKKATKEASILSRGGNVKASWLKNNLQQLYFSEVNIFVGYLTHQIEGDEKFTRVTMPVNTKNGTSWHKIAFYKKPDTARRELSTHSGKATFCTIIAGEKTVFKGKNTYRGFRYGLIPSPTNTTAVTKQHVEELSKKMPFATKSYRNNGITLTTKDFDVSCVDDNIEVMKFDKAGNPVEKTNFKKVENAIKQSGLLYL